MRGVLAEPQHLRLHCLRDVFVPVVRASTQNQPGIPQHLDQAGLHRVVGRFLAQVCLPGVWWQQAFLGNCQRVQTTGNRNGREVQQASYSVLLEEALGIGGGKAVHLAQASKRLE